MKTLKIAYFLVGAQILYIIIISIKTFEEVEMHASKHSLYIFSNLNLQTYPRPSHFVLKELKERKKVSSCLRYFMRPNR